MSLRPLLPLCFAVTFASATDYPLLNTSAPAKAFVPTSANASLVWNQETDPANIASWTSGNTGIGYDNDPTGGGDYRPQIGINVQSGMLNINGSVFIRIPFTVSPGDLPQLRSLMLRMRFDDGFVAWINGTKVASVLEPANLAWNSLTQGNGSRTANLSGWDEFDITQHLGLLHAGTNMLAIQGLNATLGSSDLLIVPALTATDVTPPPPPRWPAPAFTEVPGVGQRTRPVAIRNAGDGSGKLYIVEQRGVISVLSGGALSTFLDINVRVKGNNDGGTNEEGLLGLAFPPGFSQSRRFYVTYNNFSTTVATPTAPSVPAGSLVLSRFSTLAANPAVADPASEQILLTIPHPTNTNHNGGDIHFAKDGLLYWGTGDGGSGGDPPNNAQNPAVLLGKMLRLDVEGYAGGGSLIPAGNPWAATNDGVADQIYHLGLRNPWRWSFDRLTGDLWIGDVGQDTYEEVNFVPGNSPGLNFQWRRREALHDFSGGTTTAYGPGVITEPIIEKPRSDISVTGGYVYRGRAFPRMNGIYFFGDYGSGRFYGAQKDSAGTWRNTTFAATTSSVTTFGEDETGELYWANGSNGLVYRITDSASDNMYLSIVNHTISPAGRLTFTWGAASDRSYVPEVSTDMENWTAAGPVQAGNATLRLTFSESVDPPATAGRRYFRAREL